MKKREASRREMKAVDKSREAVIARLNVSFDEFVRELDGREAKMAKEEKRAKLVFPDPETVGFNLPAHLVGDSEDYRTKEEAHGTDKHGFTHEEVSRTTEMLVQTNAHILTQPYIFSRFGHKLAHNFAHFATFLRPLSLSLSLSLDV